MQRLLGNGVFRSDEGDTGGRYFVDSKQTATFHTEAYTDAIIGEVIVQDGVLLNKSEVEKAISPWFKPPPGFGNWHALHLSSTKKDVKKILVGLRKAVLKTNGVMTLSVRVSLRSISCCNNRGQTTVFYYLSPIIQALGYCSVDWLIQPDILSVGRHHPQSHQNQV